MSDEGDRSGASAPGRADADTPDPGGAGDRGIRPAGSLDPDDATLTVAFACVQNAGRSQMATAFAERERATRDLEDAVAIVTGGTRPADRVHPGVVATLDEVGIDVSHREPREVTVEELRVADYAITMGCAAADVCPAGWGGDARDWDLDDPDGEAPGTVREIRDEVARRVRGLFDELAEALADRDESREVA